VAEPHVGLSSARNAGLWAAEGEVVAFTDDDVIVDRGWVGWIARAFASEPDAACVTGLIVPSDLDNEAQVLMEQFAGFGKGFERRVHRLSEPSSPLFPFAAGEFGSGACTALRRDVGRALGGFDPALGAGTVSRGGEDLDLFVRVLLAGHAIVYEPAAMLAHRHPDEDRRLRSEIFSYGVGLAAMVTKQALDGQALAIVRRIPLALRHLRDPGSRKNVGKGPGYPRSYDWIERAGMAVGPVAYLRSRRRERKLD
jgi:GT2 family glycosyltransferase